MPQIAYVLVELVDLKPDPIMVMIMASHIKATQPHNNHPKSEDK
jgi:hypothetical protein